MPGSAAGWSMSCAVQWQLPQHRGHTWGVPLSGCCAVHARNYFWVWFSSVLSGECELGVVSCGLSLVLVFSVITVNSVVLPLLQFCFSKILKHFFASYQRFEESHAWFLVCVVISW